MAAIAFQVTGSWEIQFIASSKKLFCLRQRVAKSALFIHAHAASRENTAVKPFSIATYCFGISAISTEISSLLNTVLPLTGLSV